MEPSGDGLCRRTRGDVCGLPPGAWARWQLAVHELATNAAKYGALASEHGHVEISWRCEGDHVVIDWRERGGSPVPCPPNRKGFGTTLIARTVERQFRGTIHYDWAVEGLSVSLRYPGRTVQVPRGWSVLEHPMTAMEDVDAPAPELAALLAEAQLLELETLPPDHRESVERIIELARGEALAVLVHRGGEPSRLALCSDRRPLRSDL